MIHDPKAIQNTKKIFGEKISYSNSMEDALFNSSCAIIMTQWKQYEKINNNTVKKMKRKFIIDSRRILIKKNLDVDYFAIGLGKEK